MPGAFYTKHDEDPKVFHIYSECSEGEKIEVQNRIAVMTDRRICEVCARMHPG